MRTLNFQNGSAYSLRYTRYDQFRRIRMYVCTYLHCTGESILSRIHDVKLNITRIRFKLGRQSV